MLGLVGSALCQPVAVRPPEVEPWTLERLVVARSTSVRPAEIRTAVIDRQRKGSGRWGGLEIRREVYALRIPGEFWEWRDMRPTIFGLVIGRYSAARQTLDHIGGTNHYTRRDQYPMVEIPYLGIPFTCPATVTPGDVNPKAAFAEVIMTTPCDIYHEFVFRIDKQTGLPQTLEITFVKKEPPRRAVEEKIFYLQYSEEGWRTPSRVRVERPFRGRWYRSEYDVRVLINPKIRDGFFEGKITKDMAADAWKPDSSSTSIP